jgi:hypothetical protein
MKAQACVLLVSLAAGVLYGQAQPPPPAPAPQPAAAPKVQKEPTYVRRISAGVTLSVLGFSLVPEGSQVTSTTSPAVINEYNTTGASKRPGPGVTAQAAITGRFAVSGSVLLRRIGYEMATTVTTGTTTITTNTKHEDTRGRLLDVPVVLRYYSKDRHDPGPRWFVEGGGAFRNLSQARTSIDTTDNSGTNTCCQVGPASPRHRSLRGFVGGAGLQLIDPVGVRVVPEVRYTRWTGDLFNNLTTRTRRDQLEAIISLTF